jgi:ribosomal protein S14
MRWKKISNDKLKRQSFKNLEVKIISIKSLLKSKVMFFEYKNILEKHLFNYDPNCLSTKINNICIFTGRHSGVYRLFRLSRIELRRSTTKNDIFGLKKSSW